MKTISLKINDLILEETKRIISISKQPLNKYIIEALEYYNRVQKRIKLENNLKDESDLVRNESISVLKEFENIELNFKTII
jgi:hypothetical protein